MTNRRQIIWCVLGTLALPASVLAQFSTKPGTVEISAGIGGSFDFPGASAAAGGFAFIIPGLPVPAAGIPKLSAGRKSQPIVGGGAGIALTRFLWIYGDYGYLFPDRQTASAGLPVPTVPTVSVTTSTEATRHYWTGTGGVELSFPTVHRIVPLVRLGGGYVHHSYNYRSDTPNYRSTPQFITFQISNAENIPVVTFGGGVRWYWGERHGLRILVDGFRLSHGVDDVAVAEGRSGTGYLFVTRRSGGQVTVGYFLHFGR